MYSREKSLQLCIYFLDNPSIQLAQDVSFLFGVRKAVLTCIASGWPLPIVKWLMNGEKLTNGDVNQTISLKEEKDDKQLNSSLYIFEANMKHAGNFTCEAKNKYHTKRRHIQVSVTCKLGYSICYLNNTMPRT